MNGFCGICWSMWEWRQSLRVKPLPQKSQYSNLSLLWFTWCLTRLVRFWKDFPHVSHFCNFRPVCIVACFFMSPNWVNVFPHRSQTCAFRFPCTIQCRLRLCLSANPLPHTSHIWDLCIPPVTCLAICLLRESVLENVKPHTLQTCGCLFIWLIMCLIRWHFLTILFPHKSQKCVSWKRHDADLCSWTFRLFSVVSGNLTSASVREAVSAFAFCMCNSSSPGKRLWEYLVMSSWKLWYNTFKRYKCNVKWNTPNQHLYGCSALWAYSVHCKQCQGFYHWCITWNCSLLLISISPINQVRDCGQDLCWLMVVSCGEPLQTWQRTFMFRTSGSS